MHDHPSVRDAAEELARLFNDCALEIVEVEPTPLSLGRPMTSAELDALIGNIDDPADR